MITTNDLPLPTTSPTTLTAASAVPSHDDKKRTGAATSMTTTTSSRFWKAIGIIKMTLSLALILFSVIMVSAAIGTRQTNATADGGIHPAVALGVFWFSLAWLSMMEGGLNCMVGLFPLSSTDLYRDSHPRTFRCTSMTKSNNGNHDNLNRFIVGRQYLDLLIVFVTSFMVSAIDGASVLGLPAAVNNIFLQSGLAVILCTIVFGQLTAQINCAHSMLDFMNNWTLVGTTYLALFVEATGILHAVYFVQICFTNLQGTTTKEETNTNAPDASKSTIVATTDTSSSTDSTLSPRLDNGTGAETTTMGQQQQLLQQHHHRTAFQRIFFWLRILMSLGISGFAIAAFCIALAGGNTTLERTFPLWASLVSLLILLILGGFMEALQIALFAIKHIDPNQFAASKRARFNCDFILKARSDGNPDEHHSNSRLQAFLVGRQIAQTVIMFLIARIINIEMKVKGETLFGVSQQVQAIVFDSGLLNALVSTIFASLSWRVTANAFPMIFLGSPLSIWIMRLCLLVEGTGICDAAWLLAKILAYLVGYKPDEYYLDAARACDNSVDVECAVVTDTSLTKMTTHVGVAAATLPTNQEGIRFAKGHRSASMDTADTTQINDSDASRLSSSVSSGSITNDLEELP